MLNDSDYYNVIIQVGKIQKEFHALSSYFKVFQMDGLSSKNQIISLSKSQVKNIFNKYLVFLLIIIY